MYKEYTYPKLIEGKWISQVHEYPDSYMKGHPLKSYAEEVSEPAAILPDYKSFDTGHVHLQFDITTQEYKDFCADPRVSEFLNNQTVEMSVQGIDFRKGLITVLQSESVLSSSTAADIITLLDSWRSELKDTTV